MVFVGANLTFFPLHFAGLHGFPRKYVDYPDIYSFWNVISSYGSMLRLFGALMFLVVLFDSFFSGRSFIYDYSGSRGLESGYSGYVFSHSYQEEVYYRGNYKMFCSFSIFFVFFIADKEVLRVSELG